ncbi:MAG: ABC transporter permease [Chthoniobacteraceae bacterium]
MRPFLTQLRWEFRKLRARPATYFGFAACALWSLAGSLLLRVPAVRLHIQRDLWRMQWDFEKTFSGLTTATHFMGEAMTLAGSLSLTLVAAGMLAGEAEDGSMRMTFCRPISRTRVLALKLIVCAVYSTALTCFVAASALGVGLLFEGPGPLIMVATHESVLGAFDFSTGLQRYALASALLAVSALSGTLFSFTCACFPVKPATAIALALTLTFADNSIRAAPSMAHVAPYCLTTRLIAWRQVFNEDIPIARLRRLYGQLLAIDAALLAIAWSAFRRREFKR